MGFDNDIGLKLLRNFFINLGGNYCIDYICLYMCM